MECGGGREQDAAAWVSTVHDRGAHAWGKDPQMILKGREVTSLGIEGLGSQAQRIVRSW